MILRSQRRGSGHVVSPLFQCIAIFITSVLVWAMLVYGVYSTHIREPYAPVLTLTPQRIAYFGGFPADINVGLYIKDFPVFDMVKGSFVVEASLWFLFDPRLMSIDRIGKFSFEKATLVSKSTPHVRVMGQQIFVQYDIRLQFTIPLNYEAFPFDDHRINFVLMQNFLAPSEANFTALRSNLVLSPDIETSGWRLTDHRVSAGFSAETLNVQADASQEVYHPRVAFTLDFERVGIRHVISIILPLLLLFFIALFTFSIDPTGYNSGNIMSLSSTSITALIAYRFVIESISPQVGYFMFSDYVFLLFLIICCLIFFINAFGVRISVRAEKIIVVFLHVLVVVALVGLFFRL